MFTKEKIDGMRHQMVGRGNWKEVRRLDKIAMFNGHKTVSQTATRTDFE